VSAVAAAVRSAITQYVDKGKINWVEVIGQAFVGALSGSGIAGAMKQKLRVKLQGIVISIVVRIVKMFP
jgi:hypothetical protein